MIKIGLIGYGYWGPNVAKNIYNNQNFEFKYICDKNSERLSKAKNIYRQSVEYTKDYTKIIEDDDIDAVALAVETSAHFELAKAALLKGKHIYVEKPFTDNLDDAVELDNIAKKKGLIIHVDHIMVYHPVIKTIKDIMTSGDFGDILYFDCSRINLGQLKNDVSSMWDLSVHDLSIIDYLTDGQEPITVSAIGKKIYSKQESVTFMNLQYNSFLANITSSWISPIKERRILIAGSKKMIVYDDVDVLNKLIVYDKGFELEEGMEYKDYVVKTRIGDALIPNLNTEDALGNSLEHFRLSIVNNRESFSNAQSAIRMIKILEKADKSLRKEK